MAPAPVRTERVPSPALRARERDARANDPRLPSGLPIRASALQ